MIKNNSETTIVHGIITAKLAFSRERLLSLKKAQAEIDLQIEDFSRIILALERTEATLAAAVDPVIPVAVVTDAVTESVDRALGDNDVEDMMAKAMERQLKEAAE